LVEEIDETLAFDLRLQRGKPILELLLDLREPRIGVGDPLARLVVVEERRMRRRCGDQQRGDCEFRKRQWPSSTRGAFRALTQACHSPA